MSIASSPSAPGCSVPAAELIRPAYGGGCLSELLGSVAAAQGLTGDNDDGLVRYENRLGLPEADRYVVWLVDGLGWHNLRTEAAGAPWLAGLPDARTVTAPVPSTTTTSLTSFGTGTPPGVHGMVGYSFRLPGAKGAVLNPLTWNLPHNPRMVQPTPTVLERIQDEVGVTTVSLARFVDSGLTQAALRGGRFHGLVDEADEDARLEAMVTAATSSTRTLVYAYERRLDMIGHSRGWQSRDWREQLATLDRSVRAVRQALPDEVTLIVTGDHGMVDVPSDRRTVIEAVPDLAAGIDCVAGEPRFRQLWSDREDPVWIARRWADVLGDSAWVRTRDEAIDDGWFGPVADQVRARIGDVLVAIRDDSALMTRTAPHEQGMVGMHGSLTEAEMVVPLLVT